MHGVGVGGGVHRDRRDAEFLAGAQDAQRDFAAIGDEDFIEHERRVSGQLSSSSLDNHQRLAEFDRLAVLDEDLLTVPARGAGIWFIVFIASMISSVSPLSPAADLDERLGAGFGRE